MERQQMYDLMRANPAFHLATCDGDQPCVRGMFLFSADEEGIVFHTGSEKEVYAQLVRNSKVELCFRDQERGIQLRVRGQVERVDDRQLKETIVAHPTRQFLLPILQNMGDEAFYQFLNVFRLRGGRATVWTMASNLVPKEWVDLN